MVKMQDGLEKDKNKCYTIKIIKEVYDENLW